MGYMTISGNHGARHHHAIAAAFWIVVGIIAVIAFGDTLTLLAVALAVVITAWLIRDEIKYRVKRNDARGAGSRAGH
jgi:Flp pilus assembly protein TadB